MDGDGDLRSSNKGRKECRISNILRRKEKPPLSGICDSVRPKAPGLNLRLWVRCL